MSDISIYFSPIDHEIESFQNNQIGASIEVHTQGAFPDLGEAKLAIVGVKEGRRSKVPNVELMPDLFREEFYQLYSSQGFNQLIDLGDINAGNSYEDTVFALTQVVDILVRKNIVPIVIGGGNDLVYANYLGYQNLEQTVNLVTIDSKFDLGESEHDDLNGDSYLSKIIIHQPNFLFNFSNLGYQTYLNDPENIELIDKLYFDALRLGEVRNMIQDCEPIIRNADIVAFDSSVLKRSEVQNGVNCRPNGLYAEELCQLARYAGMSDKLTSVGFYEFLGKPEKGDVATLLLAEAVWCFVEGFFNRRGDFPIGSKENYYKYHVELKESSDDLVFYKSHKTGRWWIEVPYPSSMSFTYQRNQVVPCRYKDYEQALKDDMPDVWWRTYQKMTI